MTTLMDFAARSFDASRPRPLGAAPPGAPPPEPAPERQLTAAEVVGRGAGPPAWPSPDDLPAVRAARQQLKDAEENLARLKKDIDLARAASSSKPHGPEELARYLKDGKAPGRDRAAQEAAERARGLEGLLDTAQGEVDRARAAGRAAWDGVPAQVWAAVDAEWRSLVRDVARTLSAAARAQLALRAFAERLAAFRQRHRLRPGPAVPPDFHPPGFPPREAALECLLMPAAPRANNDLVILLEQLRACGVLTYAPFDLRPLDWGKATDAALLRLDDVLKEVAGQPEPKKPEPQKGG
jgi:hypothetical protein